MADTIAPDVANSVLVPPPGSVRSFTQPDTFASKWNASQQIYLNPDEAYRQARVQQTNMRRDPVIMMPLRQRQLGTALLDWQITPEDEKDTIQKHFCDKVTNIIKRIPNFFKLRMALMEAIWFGRYAARIDYEWAGDTFNTLEPRGWEPVHGDKLSFEWHTGRVGVMAPWPPGHPEQKTNTETRVVMLTASEREAFIVHKHDVEDGEFYDGQTAGAIHGIGLRTRVYWPWWLKQTLEQWRMDNAQRVGPGLQLWYFDAGNPQDEAEVRKAATNSTNETVILCPVWTGEAKNFKRVEFVEPGGAGLKALTDHIAEIELKIQKMILHEELTSKSANTGLNSNLGEQHRETLNQVMRADAINLEETLARELVWVIQRWMMPGCKWRMGFNLVKEHDDPKAILEAAKIFQDMGGEVPEDYLREAIGIPKPDDSDRVLGQAAVASQGMPGDEQPMDGEQPQDLPADAEQLPQEQGGFVSIPDGVQFVREADYERFARDLSDATMFSQGAHAPRGGIAIQGKHFPGGQFIPGNVVAQATPAQRAQLSHTREGYESVQRGKEGFSHAEENQGNLSEEIASRAKALRLPPAWRGVQISADPKSPLQAIGYDEKGRAQYRYSQEHATKQAAAKFARVSQFVKRLPDIRKQLVRDLHSKDEKTRESAAVLMLIDKTGFRVGSDRDTQAEKKAHGATTLESSHVAAGDGEVSFSFVGKKGVDIHQTVKDQQLAAMLADRASHGGRLFNITDSEVRDYLHKIAGNFKVKDFRTAVAADQAIQAMKSLPMPTSEKEYKKQRLAVGQHVSEKLGNTPTVALASYIPPEVFAPWQAQVMKSAHSTASKTSPNASATSRTKGTRPTPMAARGGTRQRPAPTQRMME